MEARLSFSLTLYSIVQQRDSWSEFLTTWAFFERILTRKAVFSDYLNFVRAFGSKVSQVEYDSRACDGFARDLKYPNDDEGLCPVAYRERQSFFLLERNSRA